MAASLRRRRGASDDDAAPSNPAEDSAGKSRDPELSRNRLPRVTFANAFSILVIARLISALFNIVHDCDETFNFWEPLHYLSLIHI